MNTKGLASKQVLPQRKKKSKKRESLEGFDHVLGMLGSCFQFVVNLAHAQRPLTLNMTALFDLLHGAHGQKYQQSEYTNHLLCG